jgi:hypothetical protein
VSDEALLTQAQRQELLAFVGEADSAADDAELVGAAADRIGLTGEMAIDGAGVLELERGDVLVVLEAVGDEDAELVDHPELLHMGVYLKADAPGRREELEQAGLLDPPEAGEPADGTPEEEGWAFTWWGALCTRLRRDAPLPDQMEALHRIMNEAEGVVERGSVEPFFERLGDLVLDEE